MYKVVFWRGARVLAENPWPYSLDKAMDLARSHLVAYAATHAQVIDTTSHVVLFRCAGEAAGKRQTAE